MEKTSKDIVEFIRCGGDILRQNWVLIICDIDQTQLDEAAEDPFARKAFEDVVAKTKGKSLFKDKISLALENVKR